MTSKSNMDSNLPLFLVLIFACNIANIAAQQCPNSGVYSCSDDCQSVLFCAAQNVPPTQNPCPPNRFCVAGPAPNTAACTSNYPICASGSVACSTYGIFPHPHLTSVKFTCTSPPAPNTVYDPERLCYCSAGENLDPGRHDLPCAANSPSPYNPIDCNTQPRGHLTDANGGNLEFCYECLSDGRITVFYCTARNQPIHPVPYVESCAAPNTEPPAPNDGGNPGNPGNPNCITEGDTFADPTDCHFYYQCDANLNAIRKPCSNGQIWYDTVKTCGKSNGSC